MKNMSCDLCDATAEGETFEAWMRALMPHYVSAHANVMDDGTKTEADKERWMNEHRARFDALVS